MSRSSGTPACQRNGAKLLIAYQRPHHAAWLEARALIRAGAIGRVLQVQLDDGGNLLDPGSEIRYILENKRVFIFKEDLNTQPRFFYFYGV